MKTRPPKVMLDGKDHMDEVWSRLVAGESSHEQSAAFLQKRCGYPEDKARRMAGASKNILKTESGFDKLARAWLNFKMDKAAK